MQGKRILLGVTGGIAAYKSPDLVRRLRERGAEVQVVMTASARQFVSSLTFQAVSGHAVRTDLWDPAAEAAMGHIELARWADLVLVAPASAGFIARLAGGQADDLLTKLVIERSKDQRAFLQVQKIDFYRSPFRTLCIYYHPIVIVVHR